MIDIKIKKNFDIGRMVRAIPKQTATLLNDIAESTIMDIRKGVEKGVDVNGRPFAKLSKATLAGKAKEGRPATILVGDNKMVGVGAGGGRRGIYLKIRASAKKLLARVSTAESTPWAVYQQEGTPPYKITPKTAKALAFTGPTGETVFAKAVNHPGLKPREWFGFSRRMLKKTDLLIRAAQERIVKAGDTPMR